MEFFDKLGKKASETYNAATEKGAKIAKETKLKMAMNTYKAEIEDMYQEIGKKVYEKHITESVMNNEEELREEFNKIDTIAEKIEEARQDIMKLKDKKQCQNCFYEIDADYNYCPNCGAKQENNEKKNVEIKEREVEIVENNMENKTENRI